MRPIIVYADQGVDGEGLKQTIKSLQMEVDAEAHPIKRMDAAKILTEDWEDTAAMLVIPGGRDVFYQASLGASGAARIQKFVAGGGSYLGLCAGAYFASGAIEFEKGGKLEVCGSRSLCFFPGLAKGPAYGPEKYSYECRKGVEAALISWENEDFFSYFNGGCYFDETEKFSNVQVLSRYLQLEGSPPSILECAVGRGRAILSGVHVEYSSERLPHDAYVDKINPSLQASEAKRKEVFRHLLQGLGVALKSA